MKFEDWIAKEPDVLIPDDAKSAEEVIHAAMKSAFEAGRDTAMLEVAAAIVTVAKTG